MTNDCKFPFVHINMEINLFILFKLIENFIKIHYNICGLEMTDMSCWMWSWTVYSWGGEITTHQDHKCQQNALIIFTFILKIF